jgi:hypothetical protein
MSEPERAGLARPPVVSSSAVKPFCRRCLVSSPSRRGEAAAVLLGGVPAEAALGEELAGLARPPVVELLAVELGGGGVRGDQPLLLAGLLARGPSSCRTTRRSAARRRPPAEPLDDSMKVRCSASIRNLMASPPAPPPWQEIDIRAGRDGERRGSSRRGTGHRPLEVAAAADAQRHGLVDDVRIEVRSRTSAMSFALTLPATATYCLALPTGRHEGPVPGDGAGRSARPPVDHHAQPAASVSAAFHSSARTSGRGGRRALVEHRPPAR